MVRQLHGASSGALSASGCGAAGVCLWHREPCAAGQASGVGALSWRPGGGFVTVSTSAALVNMDVLAPNDVESRCMRQMKISGLDEDVVITS